MATTKVTYASALTTMKDFAVNAGFDDTEVIEKINNLIAQKSKTSANKEESEAHKEAVQRAKELHDIMLEQGVTTIDNKYVRDHVMFVDSAPKATSVLKAAVELGFLKKEIVQKSATRNVLSFTLIEQS